MESRLSFINHTFHINKIKPYIEKDSINFLSPQEEQLGEVTEGR